MPKITEDQILTLIKLQKIDIETGQLEAFLKELPARIGILDQRTDESVRGVKDRETVISELNKKYRNYESDIQINLGMIQKSRKKLRSVKTNKEYQSSLKEIEDIKTKNSKIEDEMLEFLEQVEEAEKNLKERKQRYSQIVEDTKREKDSINRDAEQSKKRLIQLKSDYGVVADRLDAGLLEIFYHVKAKQTNGVGIVEVKDAVCKGCNMNIPPQLYIDLQRRDSLKNCPNCERIIYWEKHEGRSE